MILDLWSHVLERKLGLFLSFVLPTKIAIRQGSMAKIIKIIILIVFLVKLIWYGKVRTEGKVALGAGAERAGC